MIKPLLLATLCDQFGGKVAGPDTPFYSYSTDTRSVSLGDLFVALKGETFDAHDYLSQAIEGGAKGLVVNKSCQQDFTRYPDLSVWFVDDTTRALGYIAQYERNCFDKSLIAITGSSGKTTVKGMLFSIFSAYVGKDAVFATKGNLNNHFGVPFSLLELSRKHQYAVIEMGASAVGEIAYLTEIAKPDVALVNNVMAAHVEGFGSIDAIADAKGEIYNGLSDNGVAVINVDDVYADQWLQQNNARSVIGFSVSEKSIAEKPVTGKTTEENLVNIDVVRAKNISLLKNGCCSFCLGYKGQAVVVKLSVLGKHNVANAAAAAACALALGLDIEIIKKGLEVFSGESGRLQIFDAYNDCTLIDDTYNANPGSVKAAIDVLSEMRSNKILILGDMAELGQDENIAHADIGRYASNKKINRLFTVGEKSIFAQKAFGENATHFESMEKLINYLSEHTPVDSAVLVKGSRSARMERVVHAIKRCGDNNNASLAC
ncbi:MAG: UDP-N-acetylmuramoyl-tripeptide--D-alanyl-D-alanine ligase [Cellvibrionaceae bacterium]